jgi:hypothetical protein
MNIHYDTHQKLVKHRLDCWTLIIDYRKLKSKINNPKSSQLHKSRWTY